MIGKAGIYINDKIEVHCRKRRRYIAATMSGAAARTGNLR